MSAVGVVNGTAVTGPFSTGGHTRKAWASMARVVQRYQEHQRRTWCPKSTSHSSRIHKVLRLSSLWDLYPATLAAADQFRHAK
jgi:hypothetical protein